MSEGTGDQTLSHLSNRFTGKRLCLESHGPRHFIYHRFGRANDRIEFFYGQDDMPTTKAEGTEGTVNGRGLCGTSFVVQLEA